MIDKRIVVGLVIVGTAVFMAVAANWLAPTTPEETDLTCRLSGPSLERPLGCDSEGGNMITGMLYGARTSLYIGFSTILVSSTIGILLGLLAGYKGGWIDILIMRGVDLLMAFPGILLALALAALLGPSLHNIILAIAVTGWTGTARLVRGQVLSLRTREYVIAAEALGARSKRILLLHIFPGTLSPLIVHSTFSLAGVILIESSLSFLGLGSQDSSPSWGALLGQGKDYLLDAPHISIAPGLAIMTLVMALNFLGDAFRDAFDPKH